MLIDGKLQLVAGIALASDEIWHHGVSRYAIGKLEQVFGPGIDGSPIGERFANGTGIIAKRKYAVFWLLYLQSQRRMGIFW